MGRKCSVESCASDSSRPEDAGVTFHKIPRHPDLRPKWISICRIPDDKCHNKILHVCSRHFLRADFCNFKGRKYLLRHGVLPSVFPWDKSKLQAIKAADMNSAKKQTNSKRKRVRIRRGKKKQYKSELVTKDINNPDDEPSVSGIDNCPITELKTEAEESIKVEENVDDYSLIKREVKEEKDAIENDGTYENQNLAIKALDESMIRQSNDPTIDYTINSRLEVLDNNNVWYPAKINEVDFEENEILIHFEKFSTRYDEWISMSSPRLRPIQQTKQNEKYAVGERCMAVWSDSMRFPATITKLIDADSYELTFDDGLVKICKYNKLSKIDVSKPAQASPLFEPVKSTKQERRDKKRKINVAELFCKRNRVTSNLDNKKDDKLATISNAPFVKSQIKNEFFNSQWQPMWENGKPIGEDSVIQTNNGATQKSVIVPDPHLPEGWQKHLVQSIHRSSTGKWISIIVSPDGQQFRTKMELKSFLVSNKDYSDINIDLFNFDDYPNRKRKRGKRRNKNSYESSHFQTDMPPSLRISTPVTAMDDEPVIKNEVVEEKDPIKFLKIIYENDTYKCPIDGCGKNFRRENLALMHVKHYHPEYTKYLDSTPNVADLAYARTVGEHLNRSASTSSTVTAAAAASSSKSTFNRTPIEKTSSTSSTFIENHSKGKDSEIIKLLNQKLTEKKDKDTIQPLPSGLPAHMYPDIKLKDLLSKSEGLSLRDDARIKSLCSSRPLHGIKTLLPVRSSNSVSSGTSSNVDHHEHEKFQPGHAKRRKCALSYANADHKGKTSLYESQSQQKLNSHQQLQSNNTTFDSTITTTNNLYSSTPHTSTAFDFTMHNTLGHDVVDKLTTPVQFDGVIIEGGKVIKLEHMKQEEIINCTCGLMEEDGLMIQCELCLCWQHAYCNNIQKESEVPEKYVCRICQNPLRERRSMKYLHDQDWLKQGVLSVGSYHTRDDEQLQKEFATLKQCHDLTGGLIELREYMNTLAVKLKIAEDKNHPKLYLWSKSWSKIKCESLNETSDKKSKLFDQGFMKNEIDKQDVNQNDSMLMMILKGGKDEIPMLNMHNNLDPIIPKPQAAIDLDDCKLNLLDHISHAQSLMEERLNDFEKQLEKLEEIVNVENDVDYPKTRQSLQLLMKDGKLLKMLSELPTL